MTTAESAMDTAASEISDMPSRSVEVDKCLWSYIVKSEMFSSGVGKLLESNPSHIEEMSGNNVKLVFKDPDVADQLKQLINTCRDSVTVMRLPLQDDTVFDNIAGNFDVITESVPGQMTLESEDKVVVVTGTDSQRTHLIGVLQELYGLVMSAESESKKENNGACQPALKLWETRAPEPTSFDEDKGIWGYMTKEGARWAVDIEKLRNQKGVSISIVEEVDGKLVHFEISGSQDIVSGTADKLHEMIDECRFHVKTVESRKLDERVFNKASKFVTSLNKKGRAYVATVPGLFTVTGTDAEIKECQEKLKKLQVTFDAPGIEMTTRVAKSAVVQDPSTFASVSTMFEEKTSGSQFSAESLTDQLTGDFPVPIDKLVWDFVTERRAEYLKQLFDVCGVTLIASPAGVGVGSVHLSLKAQSFDMLELGIDFLSSFLGNLNNELTAQNISLDDKRDMRTWQQLILQATANRDVIVRFGQNVVIVVGNQAVVRECSATIKRIVGSAGSQRQFDSSRGEPESGLSSGNERRSDMSRESRAQSSQEEIDPEAVRSKRLQLLEGNPENGQNRSSRGDKKQSDAVTQSDDKLSRRTGTGLEQGAKQTVPNAVTAPKQRTVRFADEPQPGSAAVAATSVTSSDQKCSICQGSSSSQCAHIYCISCIQEHFEQPPHCCPVCKHVDDYRPQPISQPPDGVMTIMNDNSFRLPGFENQSTGTFVIVYSFPPGVQKEYQPHPGRKYAGATFTAFLPITFQGSRIVKQLERAFEKKLTFALLPSSNGETDEICWNGIHHKTNVFASSSQCGFPDPLYLRIVQKQLQLRGIE